MTEALKRHNARQVAADAAFVDYNFGSDVNVEDSSGWEYSTNGSQWVMPVFITTNGEQDVPSTKITFTVNFIPMTATVKEAYAINSKGQYIGSPASEELATAAESIAVASQTETAKPIKVVFEAYAVSDYGDGPQFAVCDMTECFIEKLKLMMQTCVQLKLSELRYYGGPDSWGPGDIENDLRLNCGDVVVTSDSFWFYDRPKHANYHIETRAVYADRFFNRLEEAEEGETIFCGSNEEELKRVHEDGLDPDQDDTKSVAESDSSATQPTATSPDANGESQ